MNFRLYAPEEPDDEIVTLPALEVGSYNRCVTYVTAGTTGKCGGDWEPEDLINRLQVAANYLHIISIQSYAR